jgi:DNA-binding IclR family transcriptional regulator
MKPVNAIQLLGKAGQIVDELARCGPLSAAELAKATSEPRPSVYRIVAALQQIDAVRAAGDGRFELGTAVLRWSDAAVASFVNRDSLCKQLRWVRDQLGMNVYFCVPHDDGVLCLDHVDGTAVDMLDLSPGRMLPRHAGAASSALMAFAPTEIRQELLAAAPFESIASNTPTTAEALRTKFDQIMARGWSVDDSELVEGVASVGVPVRRADGSTAAVISVSGLRASVLPQESTAAQVLQLAAQQIAAAMAAAKVAPAPVGGADARANNDADAEATRAPSLVVKAGALMEALAQERIATSARLTELIDEPVSSVYRMLATLADIGWVEQIGHRGAYRIGGKLLSLANDLTRHLDIRRAALPVLKRIHEATGETTFLCVRHGTRAVCIERIDGVRVNSRVLRLGRSLPLHVGAAPRALLAFEDREAWEEYASIAALTENLGHDISRSALYAELEEIRTAGFVVSDNTVTPGIAAVGAPIFDSRGTVAASLSVSGLRDGVLAASIDGGPSVTELVRDGAHELSDYLGFSRSSHIGASSPPDSGGRHDSDPPHT